MTTFLFSIILVFSSMHAQTYCAGDQISLTDQNAVQMVGAGYEDYAVGDDFYLADYNGELNGGDYAILFIEMSASW